MTRILLVRDTDNIAAVNFCYFWSFLFGH